MTYEQLFAPPISKLSQQPSFKYSEAQKSPISAIINYNMETVYIGVC
jgi:hypothetical protein